MRRRSRECALQMLYQLDPGEGEQADVDREIGAYWQSFSKSESVDQNFSERLVRGVVDACKDLDQVIAGVAKNWSIARMERVDRNLLRMAAYEMLYCPDIPTKVSINEALELAKRFSGNDATAFINGILDRIGQQSVGE